jgi:hypothetical protein
VKGVAVEGAAISFLVGLKKNIRQSKFTMGKSLNSENYS